MGWEKGREAPKGEGGKDQGGLLFREQNRASGKKLQSGQRRERVGSWKPSIPFIHEPSISSLGSPFFQKRGFRRRGGKEDHFFWGGRGGDWKKRRSGGQFSEPSRTIEKSGSQTQVERKDVGRKTDNDWLGRTYDEERGEAEKRKKFKRNLGKTGGEWVKKKELAF